MGAGGCCLLSFRRLWMRVSCPGGSVQPWGGGCVCKDALLELVLFFLLNSTLEKYLVKRGLLGEVISLVGPTGIPGEGNKTKDQLLDTRSSISHQLIPIAVLLRSVVQWLI